MDEWMNKSILSIDFCLFIINPCWLEFYKWLKQKEEEKSTHSHHEKFHIMSITNTKSPQLQRYIWGHDFYNYCM